MVSMLRALGEDVRCRLRSAVAVTSVAQCVEELVLNSVDAGASCIAVRVDLETFKVQVVDNGCGLCREDMERVGRRYFTSKCHSVEDLEELRFYGFRGEAIASMVDTSSVVEICSKHRDSQQTFSRLFQNGKPLEVVEVDSPRPSAGTTVTIYSLFSSLPVRRRCLDPALELERIRHRVESVSLLRQCVSFSLRNDAFHSVVLQLPKTKDLCSRFCQIYGLSRSRGLREVHHTDGTFTMQGFISREGHYNRTMQFLYVNQRLVLKTGLHKLMDSIIRKESSICRASSRPRSTTDLYGIFIVNILCPVSSYDISFQPDKTLIQFQDWDAVMSCTEQGLKIFLKRENLLLEPSKESLAASSQNHRSDSSCGEAEWFVPPPDPWNSHHSDSAHVRSKCVIRSSDVTEEGAQEDHQISRKVSETLMYSREGRKVCDHHEVTGNNDRSPLSPLHISTLHKETVFTAALSCSMSETTSSVPQTSPNPRCSRTGSASTALSCVTSEKTTSFLPSHPPSPRCSSTGSASTALSCVTSEKTTSFVPQKPPNPRCSSTGSASTALSSAMSETTSSVPQTPPNPRCSSSGSASIALSFVTREKTTTFVPQNPRNPRCNSTGSASTALSCATSENITSSVPQNHPNLRCPGTGSTSTTLFCATSEMTTCSVPPNPRCSSIESASTASSYAMSEKTTSSVPHTATYPRCPGTGSEPLQKDISKFDVCTPISAPYPLPNARQKDRATKRAKNENHRHGSEPTNIQLCVASSLGGTLDKFKRRYGKKCPVDTDHQEQPTKSPGKSEAIHLISCAGTDIPPCAVRTTPPEPLDYVGIKQRESHHPQCSPTLTTKLCRLRNQSERWWGTGKPAPSAPHDLVSFDNDANRMPCEQQSTRRHRARSADDSLDGPMSHEWLHCYQESLGKSVFINTATGLSSYSAPNRDTPAACTKDFSNMAVNVVCSGGFQYQSHPFKSQTFLPFLPRPRHERDASGQTDDGALSSLYTEWTNPVYERHPALAVDVSREHSDVLSVKIHNILCPYRFTKEMVHSMKVLQQVDSKFIACVMEAGLTTASGGQLLVLVDQHAAHERVRLEQLIADSFQGSSEFCERRLKVSVVDPALEIHVSEEEYRILRTRAGSLGRLGLSLSFPDTGTPRILVSEIPLCFLEREANETQRGRRPVLRSIVQEYLQEQVQLLQVTGAGNMAVPGSVLRVLASQACHGAVKFNHPLTMVECCQLMRSLAQCALPFQCAHGRPSILPLADLQHVATEPEVSPAPNLRRLRQRQLRWQLTK
ncbi:acylphosphatase-1 isoform X1 [Ranitomeya imitator]|uniref:acylphosphatase-1 isoform X1 n=1 Tax=Ranitomeya imitator TaxID=111125 RepID=UPI0037E9B9BA